jgi:tRNA pseudouridine38-40 synthase
MNKNFKIVIEYDGRKFFGWQRQKDKKTIQESIEVVLSKILNQKVNISASGRTDAGVHALGQVANFHASTAMSPEKLKRAVNSLIKLPIVIKSCHIVDDQFHARYSALSKEYHYFILNQEDPSAITRHYQWHIRQSLDMDKMNQCCRAITGSFNFKSFENSGSPRSSTIREVFFAKINPLNENDNNDFANNTLVFKICAEGFLKYMVRNLIGTIVLAGKHKITPHEFIKIIFAENRAKAGATAPPHGLFLKKVNY